MATTITPHGAFRRWRRSRPFWGGLLLLVAGLELFLSANLTLGDLDVHLGPEGFLSYLLPLLLVLCGVLSWVTPGQRLFYGLLGLLTAVYSLVGLNLGGFGLGTLIGIIGGALVLSWAPGRTWPAAGAPVGPDQEPATDERPTVIARGEPAPAHPGGLVPGFPGGPDEPGDPPRQPPPDDIHRRTFVITLIPLAMTATLLLAGGHTPARADPRCPEGLPSRPAAAEKEAARQSSAKPTPSRKAARKTPRPDAEGSASPSATDDAAEDGDGTGNPIVDGWHDFVEGIGDLLGVGDKEEATETPATPGPSASATPSGTASAPAPDGSGTPAPSASAGSASPSPTPSPPDVPCLGPRVFKQAGPDDVPLVSSRGSTLETASLTMYNSTYDGVIQLDTAKGKLAALKFSMDKAVNEPFSLTIPEAGGPDTVIRSKKLTTDGTVRFYTPEFKGKLFGLIPVTFTPESPPPLTLPVLWFTDVEINLAFVRCDTLTGDPLRISPRA